MTEWFIFVFALMFLGAFSNSHISIEDASKQCVANGTTLISYDSSLMKTTVKCSVPKIAEPIIHKENYETF